MSKEEEKGPGAQIFEVMMDGQELFWINVRHQSTD